MKKLLIIVGIFLLFKEGFSQGQNWKITGNNVSQGDFLGTNNNEPMIFKANGNEGLRIKPNGDLRIKNFDDNTYTGLIFINTNGVLSKLNFTGNLTDVLLGNGTFGSFSSLSGWTLGGNNIYTTYNVGIGTNVTPEKLTVNGNILANGSISGTSLNVVDIVGAGKEFKISTSLCMKGIDINTPGSRNELCGMNGDLFIQSEHNNNYNTVFGLGNGSKTGFGVVPTENFHVGVKARFDDYVYMNKIIPNDSIFTIGENTIHINTYSNNIWGSQTPSSSVKGIGFGSPSAYGNGLRAVAIGNRVRADGENSIIIGQSNAATSTQFRNTIDNSLMIGFNSNIPTITVLPANGTGTVGNVGVGTSTPGDRLQIGDDYTSFSIGAADYADLNFGTSYIGFNATRLNSGWTVKTDGAHNGGGAILSTINGGIYFIGIKSEDLTGSVDQTNLTDQQIMTHSKLIIHPNGEVTIGTNCPASGYKLGVKGGIITDEVNILITQANNCWPDYVFNKEYELPSLKEVEEFTTANKHLPGIPSASEIESSGINVADMNISLLKKTEEITLYLIDMEKKLEKLTKENEELKARIILLEN